MARDSNTYTTFIVESEFYDRTVTPNVAFTLTYALNAPLVDTTVGKGEVKVSAIDCATDLPAVTNNGLIDVTLTDVTCLAKSLNGTFAYYSVVGGLPAGDYLFKFHFVTKTAGVYVSSIYSVVKVTVTDQGEVLCENCSC